MQHLRIQSKGLQKSHSAKTAPLSVFGFNRNGISAYSPLFFKFLLWALPISSSTLTPSPYPCLPVTHINYLVDIFL